MTSIGIHRIKSIKIDRYYLDNVRSYVIRINIKNDKEKYHISLFSNERIEIKEED